MTESKHARARRAAVFGLVLQIAASIAALALFYNSVAVGLFNLFWLLACGVPVWFITLLVLRQKELAQLEAEDLEDLKREKAATGAGGALFGGEGGAIIGQDVAKTRLEWMLRWLVPVSSALIALLIGFAALWQWQKAPIFLAFSATQAPRYLEIVLTILSVLMLLLFLMARYAAGLAKVEDWQLLRGGGSYLFAGAIATAALLAVLTMRWYAAIAWPEQYFAYAIPTLMGLLAIEMLINVVGDIYRPRRAGVEMRAAFDSRLLGLASETGGVARSLADAINYQFGFEISQSWFYQLLQRSFFPLLGAGVVALWLLSGIVLVNPGEHAIIEHWGRQLNASSPLGPGIHLKWPAPIQTVQRFPTGVLQEMVVGYKEFDARPVAAKPTPDDRPEIMLWSQEQHQGQTHFDFVISPDQTGLTPSSAPTDERATAALGVADAAERSQSVAVNCLRMAVSLQYRIDAEKLSDYTQQVEKPEETLRNLAWAEVVKFNAAHDMNDLLSEHAGEFGETLRARLRERIAALKLGLDLVYVGIFNVHPDPSVAEAYRGVIDADQQRVGAIREALVVENQTLSAVAGDKNRARALTLAIDQFNAADRELQDSEETLAADAAKSEALKAALAPLTPILQDRSVARERVRRAQQAKEVVGQEFEAGIGSNLKLRARADEAVVVAEQELARIEQQLNDALAPIRAAQPVSDALFTAAIRRAQAGVERTLWSGYLENELTRLEGESAARLSEGQAERWEIEMTAETELKTVQNEQAAYAAAPTIYRLRAHLSTLARGLRDKRKFVVAIDPTGRELEVRVNAEQEASQDVTDAQMVSPSGG